MVKAFFANIKDEGFNEYVQHFDIKAEDYPNWVDWRESGDYLRPDPGGDGDVAKVPSSGKTGDGELVRVDSFVNVQVQVGNSEVVRMDLGVLELLVDVLIGWQVIIHKGFWSLLWRRSFRVGFLRSNCSCGS
jgi:hypothetical protein